MALDIDYSFNIQKIMIKEINLQCLNRIVSNGDQIFIRLSKILKPILNWLNFL